MEYLTNEEIGQLIKQRREEMGWTQTQLGEKLGVGAAAVNKWELGTVQNIKREVLRNLCITLKLHPAYLIGIPERQSIMHIEDLTQEEMQEVLNFMKYIKTKRK